MFGRGPPPGRMQQPPHHNHNNPGPGPMNGRGMNNMHNNMGGRGMNMNGRGVPMNGRGGMPMNGRGMNPMMGRGPMPGRGGPGRGMSGGHQPPMPGRHHHNNHSPMPGRHQQHMGPPRAPPPPPPPPRPPFPQAHPQNGLSPHQMPPMRPMQQQPPYGNMSHNNLPPGHQLQHQRPPPPPPRPPFPPPTQNINQMQHNQHPVGMPPPNHMGPPRHLQPPPMNGNMQQNHHNQPHHQQSHQQQYQRPPHNQFPPHGHQQQLNNAQANSFVAMAPPLKPQHQQQPPAAAAASPKPATTHYSQAQIDQAWTEYANDKGVKYYHNSILQTSTYNKPATFVTSQQSQLQAQQQQQQQPSTERAVAAAPAASTPRPWAEYTDANTGKKYYSNGVTTTWERPEGLVSSSLSAATIVAQSNANEEETSTGESARKKRKMKAEKETPFRNNEEALAAFKGLLLAKGVLPTAKWNDVVKMCSSDSRWADCEAVLTTGERKQAMAEFQTKRANELRTKERQERARAKDAFLQLLSESLPKQASFSVWNSRFGDVRDSIAKDDRFYAVQDEETRESLFLDFCEELRKHDERKKRNKKREAQDAFNSFLKEKEEAGTLSFLSTWNSFLAAMSESDKHDSRFQVSSFMSDSDRQVFFADFAIELQAAEDDKRRRIRDARRRAEKAQRDAYRDSLEKLAAQGKITPSSHWRDVERIVESDGTYQPVHEQDRDAPREIFEEFAEEWDETYRRDRQVLSQLVLHPTSKGEILITSQTSYDEFAKALLEEANASPQTYAEVRRITKAEEPISSARLYFNELLKKAKETKPLRRRGHGGRRGSLHNDDSSEDEGEIIEDGEENENPPKESTEPLEKSQPQSSKDDQESQRQDTVETANTSEQKQPLQEAKDGDGIRQTSGDSSKQQEDPS
ncbi:PRP40 pre-mRNA processing factor 40 homolog [Seminavis robusta]|uniref:PRP40 pre-mRNA processing factor 40 homolog n=1 Tax=Seminavis robusta TaxID=568900 RepID=A0A9N8H9V7_9STRA|nr:PRP40 pre-mRNA processing factor 40 homolog [Seminavis robusta]|eukprot:Sro294_g110220.1 PRP40 pre-mRNA processing factor 40 homolog (911) ;mRNA; f:31081-33962